MSLICLICSFTLSTSSVGAVWGRGGRAWSVGGLKWQISVYYEIVILVENEMCCIFHNYLYGKITHLKYILSTGSLICVSYSGTHILNSSQPLHGMISH